MQLGKPETFPLTIQNRILRSEEYSVIPLYLHCTKLSLGGRSPIDHTQRTFPEIFVLCSANKELGTHPFGR